ncbi:ubiquitin carboxyl-terminal hydrolase isozyme L5 [Piptocephalis cylindrospora]|uniref:Ubiquitin carboxyl-terminal hydrolase n=1 Tax=Piptocephalis cylindrospora TaxID=1907219 RepID=A0A4P9XYP3_9FUNG|nr:ubiquitin carboxyl-terminal hydrolase isozyme L5 [Piptocephalis cylindrospora]|eukprot:RKP11556.1 ubiquitin carboxyl-terminal hydrolase isozyme L5 [Piptocephalis cylindrospora]
MADWGPIESDPALFTQLIWDLGAKDVQVEELWDLSDPSLSNLPKPVYGLIFLFKWEASSSPPTGLSSSQGTEAGDDHGIFFAQQVIQNACATQAILSILFNQQGGLALGSGLEEFYQDVSSFPKDMRGLALSNSDLIRSVHNRFSRSDPFVNDGLFPQKDEDKEDPFHFVSFVPIHGALYELDGLAQGPIHHGACSDEDWLGKAREVIQKRMQAFPSSEIRFNLMAVTKSRLATLRERKVELEERMRKCEGDEEAISSCQIQISSVEQAMAEEASMETRYRKLNAQRTHNYIEFIQVLVEQLAKKDQLDGAIQRAESSSNRQGRTEGKN